MIKLEDVAKKAGLSKATVSLALNGNEKVNIKTRKRVEKIAREMGYRPNPYAQKLATRKSKQIGLIIPDIENVYYASLVHHISYELNKNQYGLIISTSINSIINEERIIEEMIENRVDGLLLAPVNQPNNNASYLEKLEQINIPMAFVTSMYSKVKHPCVMCDLYDGMVKGITALFQKGYRKIALLSGPKGAYSLDLRLQGYQDALRTFNLSCERVYHLDDVSYSQAYRWIQNLPFITSDAFVCVNDMMALGVINALLAQGIKVPENIAVMGYDDVIFADVSPVPITTVQQNIAALSTRAVDLILDMIRKKSTVNPPHVMLPCNLVLRQSI